MDVFRLLLCAAVYRGLGEKSPVSCVNHHHFKPLWFKLITEVKTKAGLKPLKQMTHETETHLMSCKQ